MPLAVEEFSRRVTECGLMSAAEMAAFQAGLPQDRALKDAQDLARELVRQKRLTEFQAISVYKGQTDMLVIGEYVVLDKIGTGGMGRVYKAEHRRMARRVAIKLLAEGAMSSPETIQRFEQEVRTSARLDHPNVVAAHDAGEHRGLHYLVMQYVDGRDLKSVVRERGRMPLDQAVSYIYQAACGLEHAHAEGVTHRDIKPGNLMVDKRGVVKVLDMGLARIEEDIQDEGKAPRGRLTLSNQTLGTADYMPPEQAEDTRMADARSDIYALGCTLYYLLTGHPPYVAETAAEIMLMHHNAPVPSLRAERADVPEGLEIVYQRMVAKVPGERYQTMAEVLTALETCGVAFKLPQGVKMAALPPSGGAMLSEPATPPQSDSSPSAPREPGAGSGSVVRLGTGSSISSPTGGSQRESNSANDETVVFAARQLDTDVGPLSSVSDTGGNKKLVVIAAAILAAVVLGALATGALLLSG
jgi:serine/threonine protein kinase